LRIKEQETSITLQEHHDDEVCRRIKCTGIIARMKQTINAWTVLVRIPKREFHLEDSSIDKNGNTKARYIWTGTVVWTEFIWLRIWCSDALV